MPLYLDASITTIDGAFTVLDDPIDVADGSEWPAGNFTIKVWDSSDVKVLKAVIYVGTRTANSLSDLIWNYGGHTDVNLADGDYVALEIAAPNYPTLWTPATVGAYDDYFFEDNSADWTAAAISGTATWHYNYQARFGIFRGVNCIYEDMTDNGDVAVYVKTLSGIAIGDYIQTAFVPFRRFTGAVELLEAGIILTNGTTAASTGAMFTLGSDSNVSGKIYTRGGLLNNVGGGATNFLNQVPSGQPIHFRLTYQAANTFRASYSLDGENFSQALADLSQTLTPTLGGFMVSSSETEPHQARFLYFHSNVTP